MKTSPTLSKRTNLTHITFFVEQRKKWVAQGSANVSNLSVKRVKEIPVYGYKFSANLVREFTGCTKKMIVSVALIF